MRGQGRGLPAVAVLRGQDVEPAEALTCAVGEMIGVGDQAAKCLASVFGISTVGELANSDRFGTAALVAERCRDGADSEPVLLPPRVVDRAWEDRPAAELLAADVSVFLRIGPAGAAQVEKALGVGALRDLAVWPPYVAARALRQRESELSVVVDDLDSMPTGAKVVIVDGEGNRSAAVESDGIFRGGVRGNARRVEVRDADDVLIRTHVLSEVDRSGTADLRVGAHAQSATMARRLRDADRRRQIDQQSRDLATRVVGAGRAQGERFLPVDSSPDDVLTEFESSVNGILNERGLLDEKKLQQATVAAFRAEQKLEVGEVGAVDDTLLSTEELAPLVDDLRREALEEALEQQKQAKKADGKEVPPTLSEVIGDRLADLLAEARTLGHEELVKRIQPLFALELLGRMVRSDSGLVDTERPNARQLHEQAAIGSGPADSPALYEYSSLRPALPYVWSNLFEWEARKALRDFFRTQQKEHDQEAWKIPDEISAEMALEELLQLVDELGIDSRVLAQLRSFNLFISEERYLSLEPDVRSQIESMLEQYWLLDGAVPSGTIGDKVDESLALFFFVPGSPDSHPVLQRDGMRYLHRAVPIPDVEPMVSPPSSAPEPGSGGTYFRVFLPSEGRQTKLTEDQYLVRVPTYRNWLRGQVVALAQTEPQDDTEENGEPALAPVTSSIEALATFLSRNDHLPFDVGTARAVNFGVMLKYSQIWIPLACQVGDLVDTMPLAPGETRKYTTRTVVKKDRRQKELETSLKVIGDESQDTGRTESEIVKRANKESRFATHAEAKGTIGMFSVSGSDQRGGKAFQDPRRRTRNSPREAVSKASQQFKEERSVEVETTESTTFEETTSGEISNPNNEIPVTYLFYELQRRHLVTEQLTGIQPVVMVAAPVPPPSDVNESFLIRHDWILKRVLLDDSYREAFDLLQDSQVARQVEVGVRRRAVERQLEAMRETKEQLRAATGLRDRALAEIGEAVDRLAATAIGTGAADTATTILTGGLAQMFSGGGGGVAEGVQEAAEMQEEAAQAALARIDREMNRLRTRLEAGTAALEQAIDSYAKAVTDALRREQAIVRLRVHVAENILHYMQAIWEYEILDQRFFALHDVQVPDIAEQTTDDGVKLSVNVAYPLPLAQVADIENLLGIHGNYLVFPLLHRNALTRAMEAEYKPLLLDKAILDRLAAAPDLSERAEQLVQRLGEGKSSKDAPAGFSKDSWQVVTVPSGHLHIEALPGAHPVLEDFKLKHRQVDVLAALAETTIAETEAMRRLLRLLLGKDDDPDVEGGTIHIATDGSSGEGE